MSRMSSKALRKQYDGRYVVENLSLEISSGEIVGLLGPNGAGKTTSFQIIVGLIRPDGGSIEIDDEDISHFPIHMRAKRGIGYLPQEPSVFRSLTVEQNILAIAELRKDINKKEQTALVDELLEEFRLGQIRTRRATKLSGGERRRLEIARTLAIKPKFILMDEPFAGVDPISIGSMKSEIQGLANKNIGILITDHQVRETLEICHRAYIVNEGHVIAEGTTDTILSNRKVRQVYLGNDFSL
ncbi:MAG: LPS export ABC transporter ATP-binding protein [Pseudomonadales bacterium]|nr:LPS export ABC transporter ATP-binding protein [Pseudomonadales bacterium]